MKKLIIIAAGLMLWLGTSASATWGGGDKKSKVKKSAPVVTSSVGVPTTVTDEISKSFTTQFASAENVSWKLNEGFYFADFRVNKQDMFAAYNAGGELLGVSRNIKLSQLPLHVEMAIKENYKDYKIADIVTELVFEGETTYHLYAENQTRYLKLKCDSNGHITILKRTKKKLIGSVY